MSNARSIRISLSASDLVKLEAAMQAYHMESPQEVLRYLLNQDAVERMRFGARYRKADPGVMDIPGAGAPRGKKAEREQTIAALAAMDPDDVNAWLIERRYIVDDPADEVTGYVTRRRVVRDPAGTLWLEAQQYDPRHDKYNYRNPLLDWDALVKDLARGKII